MLHNIEDFCNKIISIADQAKRLKEESKSGHNAEIQSKVEDLQMQCRNVGNEGKEQKENKYSEQISLDFSDF